MTDIIQPSELQILILAIALTPLMAWAFRGIEIPRKIWLGAAITAIMASYVATVAEGFVAPELMNTAEHLLIAIAGCCFLIASVNVLRWRIDSDKTGREK